MFLLLLCGIGLWFYLFNKDEDTHDAPPIFDIVTRKDLIKSIDAEGRVKGNDTMVLSFPLSDKLIQVNVAPWDTVSKGDVLAKIDPRNYNLALRRNTTAVQQAQQSAASLRQPLKSQEIASLQEQIKLQELALSQVKIANSQRIVQAKNAVELAQANLEQLLKDLQDVVADNDTALVQNNNDIQITNAQNSLQITNSDILASVEQIMREIDILLWLTDLNKNSNDSYEDAFSAKDITLRTKSKIDRYAIHNVLEEAKGWLTPEQSLVVLQKTIELVATVQDMIENSVTNVTLSTVQISSWATTYGLHRSTLLGKKNQLVQAMDALNILESSVASALDTVDDRQKDAIDALEWQIRTAKITYEKALADLELAQEEAPISLQSSQSQLDKARLDAQIVQKPLSSAEEAIQQLQIKNAQIGAEEATYQLEKTVLRATEDWVVLTVDNVVWEYPSPQFITMAIDANKYVEVLIEEEEVNNIYVWQEVRMTLDARDDITVLGEVYYVSSVWQRDLNDIVQYQILIKLTDTNDITLRSEMTINAEFVVEDTLATLVIPTEYLVKQDDSYFVTTGEGELIEVSIGMTNDEEVEIVQWLSEGESILLPNDDDG